MYKKDLKNKETLEGKANEKIQFKFKNLFKDIKIHNLRLVAKKQILRLLKKIEISNKRDFYKNEITKLLTYEKNI